MELVYGVMVTQLFLVQSFKVRVLVDQQKNPATRGIFCFMSRDFGIGPEVSGLFFRYLDFKRHHWSYCMIYQIFADAAIKEVRETGASVGTHAY